ncbi:MAG: hypothetical protein ABI237_08300 [Ginsengibacter sp.]
MKKNKWFLNGIIFSLMVLLIASCTKQGPQGIPGNPGTLGPAGSIGPAGKDGNKFLSGQGIPNVQTGNTGDYYLDEKNSNLYGPKTSDGWGTPFSFSGGSGGSILSGSNAPGSSIGSTGDFYLDTVNYVIYGPKATNGHWNTGLMLNGTGGSSGVTEYLINNPYDYFTGSSDVGYYLDIEYDNDNKFNLWDAVNQQQDLLAIYLKQKIPMYARNYDNTEDSIIGYENMVSSADGMVPAVTNNQNESDGGIEAFYSTNESGLIVNFYHERYRCGCYGSNLLNALKADLGLQLIMVFVISPSAINNITPPQPAAPHLRIRNPYTNSQVQQLIKPYLK